MKKLICKIFGHKYVLGCSPSGDGYRMLAICQRCGPIPLSISLDPTIEEIVKSIKGLEDHFKASAKGIENKNIDGERKKILFDMWEDHYLTRLTQDRNYLVWVVETLLDRPVGLDISTEPTEYAQVK